MEEERSLDLETISVGIDDPRADRTIEHQLRDIIVIVIVICGVVCEAEEWVDIKEFRKAKEAWFKGLLGLPNGIPSHDTFGGSLTALISSNWKPALCNGIRV